MCQFFYCVVDIFQCQWEYVVGVDNVLDEMGGVGIFLLVFFLWIELDQVGLGIYEVLQLDGVGFFILVFY